MLDQNILERIIAQKKLEIASRQRQQALTALQQKVSALPACRGFKQAIEQRIEQRLPAVIAEIKKASPSKGLIRENFSVLDIAQSYQQADATCISVLTDEHFFQGSDDYLLQVHNGVNLPLLRKDFMIDIYQIYESRLLGADCVLLIMACLDDETFTQLYNCALALGMDVLVEVHNHAELMRALKFDVELLGINNRDLTTFKTDINTSLQLKALLPADITLVTESGIHTRDDVQKLRSQGIHAFLIGEAFMRVDKPGIALRELFELN